MILVVQAEWVWAKYIRRESEKTEYAVPKKDGTPRLKKEVSYQ